MELRTGLDAVKKGKLYPLPKTEPWFLSCSAHNLVAILADLSFLWWDYAF
jgi:hypothetical protein